MKKLLYPTITALIFSFAVMPVYTQTAWPVRIIVKNKDTRSPIAEAIVSIKDTDLSAVTDQNGSAQLNVNVIGEQIVTVTSPGYEKKEVKVAFPLKDVGELTVLLELNNEVGSVTITSTRTGREIEAEPTRIEAIDEEELGEKINMRPANVSMALYESTGIQVQQTSAVSGTQTIRIQGLDGRYTQILKDGFPAYGGFSGSLSVLEIPPLDLKQVEVIKGPSATLFGGDAIAGVVNFISKDPEEKPVTTLLFNQTSAGGTDVSVFNSQRFAGFGYTLLGSANFQREYDVDGDHFTELPRTRSFALNPKLLFYIDDKTRLTVGNSVSYRSGIGGDIIAIKSTPDADHSYFEENRTFRNITTINLDREMSGGGRLNAKQSIAFFSRNIETPFYEFRGRQFNSFTDVSYFQPVGKHIIVLGGSAVIDRFTEEDPATVTDLRDEARTTFGGFIQDTVDLSSRLSIEAGFRIDNSRHYGIFALPRVSLLYRISDKLTTRIGGGFGYKTPTVFTEEAERLLFQNVLPVGSDLKAERSRGGTFDINYQDKIGENLSFSLNQMFFYTQILDPIILRPFGIGQFRFLNSDSSVISRGFETNLRVTYGIAKLFAGYTFTDAKAGYLSGDRHLTLLPRSRVNSSLVFEQHENFKAGAEFYFQSRQTRDDRIRTRSTAEVGLFGEKTFGRFSIFFNAENLTDVRQSRYEQVVIPPYSNPTFRELWTHSEGRIFNGGVKIKL